MCIRFFPVLYITSASKFAHALLGSVILWRFYSWKLSKRYLVGGETEEHNQERTLQEICGDVARSTRRLYLQKADTTQEHFLSGQVSSWFLSVVWKRVISSSTILTKKHFTFSSGQFLYRCAPGNCASKIKCGCCAQTILELK